MFKYLFNGRKKSILKKSIPALIITVLLLPFLEIAYTNLYVVFMKEKFCSKYHGLKNNNYIKTNGFMLLNRDGCGKICIDALTKYGFDFIESEIYDPHSAFLSYKKGIVSYKLSNNQKDCIFYLNLKDDFLLRNNPPLYEFRKQNPDKCISENYVTESKSNYVIDIYIAPRKEIGPTIISTYSTIFKNKSGNLINAYNNVIILSKNIPIDFINLKYSCENMDYYNPSNMSSVWWDSYPIWNVIKSTSS